MVLIISAIDDLSTNDVIDWMFFYNVKFLRISEDDEIRFKSVKISCYKFDIELYINNHIYMLSDFKSFWYRRSHFNVLKNIIHEHCKLDKQINNHLLTETGEIQKLFLNYIKKNSLNHYHNISLNKIEVLNTASSLGLKIPDTIITGSKLEVKDFIGKHDYVITKNFSQGVFIFNKNRIFDSTTKIITPAIYDMLPDNFAYTMIQEGIDKLFELRIFFLAGDFYASAIFSQNDSITSIDFRNYNHEKPNRTPPFLLPTEIRKKIKKLMLKYNLNSGSIDMLISTTGEFIFLEINPIGQFAQVSLPCNYHLEEKIAKYLLKINK